MLSQSKQNRIRSGLEYLISIVFTIGALSLVTYDPPSGQGPVAELFGSKAASIIYIGLFAFNGIGLLYAKLKKRKILHKHILMSCYLTSLFVFLLELGITGWGWDVIDFPIIFFASAWCWLKWKMQTEYLDPAMFDKMTRELRDDLPPTS